MIYTSQRYKYEPLIRATSDGKQERMFLLPLWHDDSHTETRRRFQHAAALSIAATFGWLFLTATSRAVSPF